MKNLKFTFKFSWIVAICGKEYESFEKVPTNISEMDLPIFWPKMCISNYFITPVL